MTRCRTQRSPATERILRLSPCPIRMMPRRPRRVVAGASVILTWNLRDFPTRELKKHGLVRQDPDVFLTALYDKAPDLTLASLANARRNLSKTCISAADFID